MKCPTCHFENPEGMNFCGKCGVKIELVCPSCNASNPPGFTLCGKCGKNLELPSKSLPRELTFDEKIINIQKYLPRGLAEKVLAQRDKIEGEKRQVTVMFCDMKGFTSLADKLGPEEVYCMMDQVYEVLIRKVHDYEGTINEMTGDGIMALFGAPIALEDAPQKAIRSAMAIHREMTRFNEHIKQEKGDLPTIKMRIGIHTGPVVVGTLGNDLRVEFKAVGDTVNLASRMEELAEPGTTYISDVTFKLTEGLFRFEALGEKEIRGKEKPIRIYQVIAPSTRRTRFDVSAERGLTPFVGRERELELLLDGFERSREGKGQAISIVSEAGIGKSRLLYEFRKAVTNEYITFLEGRCLSYSRNIAYHPVVDLLKANFDIQDTDTDQEIREKVSTGLNIMKVNEASTLPYLLELLSVKESGIDKIPLSPEAKKERTIEALKKIILSGSEIRPLIMATEDLHWMDRSSEDAMKELMDSIAGARVFLIFTYRPEFVHAWGSRSYHSQVTLNKLSNRETLIMATHMLGTPNIDSELEELILQKTEGIPFFIEEFIKSLKDLKVIVRKEHQYRVSKDLQRLTIPSTIQDVIMTRVDALSEGAKELLRIGSVIEREFSYELIKRVTGLPEKALLSHLSILKDSELLYERGIYPKSTYIFKHALTREVVYDSILTKKRKQMHEIISSMIENLFKDSLPDHYGILAGHCIASENYKKGAEYSRLEAKRYQKTGLYKDAIEYAKKSINCLEKLPQIEAVQKKRIDARTTLANYYLSLNYHVEAKEAVESIVGLAQDMNYKKRLPGIFIAMGMYNLIVEENFMNGLSYMDKAIDISEEEGDFLSLWIACVQLGWVLSHMCEFEKALIHLQKCLELSKISNNQRGISFSKCMISHVYALQGNISLAIKMSEEALNMSEDGGDVYIRGWVYINYGPALYYRGVFNEAEKHLLEGLACCEKTSQIAWGGWAASQLGLLYFHMGAYKKAQEYHLKVISSIESAKILPSWAKVQRACIARAKACNKEGDIYLTGLFEDAKNVKLKICEGIMARSIGDILLNMDDDHLLDAELWIKKAIDADKKNGMKWSLGTDHLLYADWFKRQRNFLKTKENLNTAIGIFRECGADGWVTLTEKALAEIT